MPFQKGHRRLLGLKPKIGGSSPHSYSDYSENIFCFKEEIRAGKSPETLDAVGVQPTASKVLR